MAPPLPTSALAVQPRFFVLLGLRTSRTFLVGFCRFCRQPVSLSTHIVHNPVVSLIQGMDWIAPPQCSRGLMKLRSRGTDRQTDSYVNFLFVSIALSSSHSVLYSVSRLKGKDSKLKRLQHEIALLTIPCISCFWFCRVSLKLMLFGAF